MENSKPLTLLVQKLCAVKCHSEGATQGRAAHPDRDEPVVVVVQKYRPDDPGDVVLDYGTELAQTSDSTILAPR